MSVFYTHRRVPNPSADGAKTPPPRRGPCDCDAAPGHDRRLRPRQRLFGGPDTRSRSNSANTANIRKTILPAAVVVSIRSDRLTRSAPALSSSCSRWMSSTTGCSVSYRRPQNAREQRRRFRRRPPGNAPCVYDHAPRGRIAASQSQTGSLARRLPHRSAGRCRRS